MSSGIWEGEQSESKVVRYWFSNLPVQARMFLKLVAIALVLLPAILVLDRIYLMVKERENYYHKTAQEIAHLWGKKQLIKGPVLTVPFQTQDGRRSYVHILPEN
jgi:inner membrane protein involved in colicin E2 resistance